MKTLLYVIWALFMVAGVWAMIHAVRQTKKQERLIAGWPKTRAVVTGSRQGWTHGGANTSRNIRYWPIYRFVDPHGVVQCGESEVSYANKPVPGTLLEVSYNPADPTHSFHLDAPSRLLIGCVIPVMVLLCMASFWFIGFLPLD